MIFFLFPCQNFIFEAYCLIGVSYYAVLLSEWVSVSITIESEPPTNCANFDPMLPNLWNFPGAGVFSEYFTEMLLSYIFRPRVVKYDILRNNRCSKLHAVLDCLFFSLKRHSLLRGEHNGIITPNLANRHMPAALLWYNYTKKEYQVFPPSFST